MNLRSRQLVALGLAFALLWVTAVVGVQVFNHAGAHAHHQSATHATVICSWFCAAGQGVETIAVHVDSVRTLLAILTIPAPDRHITPILAAFLSRGPPTRA